MVARVTGSRDRSQADSSHSRVVLCPALTMLSIYGLGRSRLWPLTSTAQIAEVVSEYVLVQEPWK